LIVYFDTNLRQIMRDSWSETVRNSQFFIHIRFASNANEHICQICVSYLIFVSTLAEQFFSKSANHHVWRKFKEDSGWFDDAFTHGEHSPTLYDRRGWSNAHWHHNVDATAWRLFRCFIKKKNTLFLQEIFTFFPLVKRETEEFSSCGGYNK